MHLHVARGLWTACRHKFGICSAVDLLCRAALQISHGHLEQPTFLSQEFIAIALVVLNAFQKGCFIGLTAWRLQSWGTSSHRCRICLCRVMVLQLYNLRSLCLWRLDRLLFGSPALALQGWFLHSYFFTCDCLCTICGPALPLALTVRHGHVTA